MLPLGTTAPEFQLSDTDGSTVSLDDLDGSQGLVVLSFQITVPS